MTNLTTWMVTAAMSAAAVLPAPAPAGLLQEIRTGRHAGYDRLVLEFGGVTPPTATTGYVAVVRTDPADQPVPLRGTAFLRVALHDATLDTTPREPDPADARRYTGPHRVTPNLPVLRDVAVAGDFEGVLSFGVGLARRTPVRVFTLTAPARVVLDFQYGSPGSGHRCGA
jgi:hypothetical protein